MSPQSLLYKHILDKTAHEKKIVNKKLKARKISILNMSRSKLNILGDNKFFQMGKKIHVLNFLQLSAIVCSCLDSLQLYATVLTV